MLMAPRAGRVGNAAGVRLSLFLLTIACTSLVFMFDQNQLKDFRVIDLDLFQNLPLKMQSQTSHTSLGRRIVEKAFNETYADLVEACGSPDEENSLKDCLVELYEKREAQDFSSKWPWWFQTMVRDSRLLSTGLFGDWHFLQFPDPPMQMCVYEKGGTKMWRVTHCEILAATVTTFTTSDVSLTSCYNLQSPPATENVSKSVFLRDPLERFLSAFLDKCASDNRVSQTHCQPNVIFRSNQTDHVADFMQQDTRTLFEIHVETSPLKWDLHFLPLSLHCEGLYRRIQHYDFVGMMNENFYQELFRFLKQYPSPVLESKVRSVFKLDGRENETNYGTEGQASLHTSDYYTANTIRRVLQYTSIDYKLLNLPIPQWAENILQRDETFLL